MILIYFEITRKMGIKCWVLQGVQETLLWGINRHLPKIFHTRSYITKSESHLQLTRLLLLWLKNEVTKLKLTKLGSVGCLTKFVIKLSYINLSPQGEL